MEFKYQQTKMFFFYTTSGEGGMSGTGRSRGPLPLVERPLSKGKAEVHCLLCPCVEGSASVLATVFLFRAAGRGSSLF